MSAATIVRRRREAALRLPPLPDGYRDPLDQLADRKREQRDLMAALDHLDVAGLCTCWVAGRKHQRAA